MQAKFAPYSGYLMGLPTTEDHLVFRWNHPGCKVLFSVCRRGSAASCHFASDKAGLRLLRTAINDFVNYVFWLFDWCTIVTAQVEKSSVAKLIEKCGFEYWFNADDIMVYKRLR